MDSFLKGKLASAKAKLSSAAQYIQNKEIVKNVQATIAKKRAEREQRNAINDDGAVDGNEQEQEDGGFTKVEFEGEGANNQGYQPQEGLEQQAAAPKKKGIINGIKNKIEEVKKHLGPKINEKLLYVTSSLNHDHETEEEE